MPGYYDYILGAIPLALLGITAMLTTTGMSLTTAVPPAAGVSVLLIGHALFVNGPVDEPVGAADASPINAPVNAD